MPVPAPEPVPFPGGGAPSGPAGGDLTGTYPDPTLANGGKLVVPTGAAMVSSFISAHDATPSIPDATFTTPNLDKYYEIDGGRSVADAVFNSTTTVTSATAAFTQADVGSAMYCFTGTDARSDDLIDGGSGPCVIVSVESPTSCTISNAAQVSGSGKSIGIHPMFSIGTDGSATWVNILQKGVYHFLGIVNVAGGDDPGTGTTRMLQVGVADWAGVGNTNYLLVDHANAASFAALDGLLVDESGIIIPSDMVPVYVQLGYFQDSGGTRTGFHALGVSIYRELEIVDA